VGGDFVENTRDVVESAGGEILFVELCCSTEELERRIEHPSRKRFGKLDSVVTFRELQASGAFVDPGLPKKRLIVDTTKLSASDSASLIATELGFKVTYSSD